MKERRIKDIARLSTGQTPPRNDDNNFSDEPSIDNYMWIKPEDMHSKGLVSDTKEYITKKGLRYIKKYNKESVIFNGIGAGIGNVALSDGFFTTNQQNHVLYNCKNYKYLYYFLIAHKNLISQLSTGNVVPILNGSRLKNFIVLDDNNDLLDRIVSFLDDNCSKIDKKITLLQNKAICLDEYKNSLIYESITKGLDNNVEMKDSGVNWIGEIPIKWKVKRVKEISNYMTGFTPSTSNESFYDGLDKWITIGDMNGKYIKESKKTINGSLFKKTWKTPENSLLFSFKLSIGQVAFNDTPVFTNEAICSFLRTSKINLDYFYYSAPIFIVKNAKKNIFNADLLNQDLIANAICLFPPKKEQIKIAKYLDQETQKIEEKIELINKKVELLREYKQSLIYEAVTGQLDI